MVVGGIVRRLVTPSHPGDPALDDPHSSVQCRVEYLATEFDPPVWTVKREEAFLFVSYSEGACIRAKALVAHAIVASPPDQNDIPEELQPLEPLQILPPPPAYPAKKKQRKRVTAPIVSERRRDWVTETYG